MSYNITTLDDDHIVIFTMNGDFNMTKELNTAVGECHALAQALGGPLVYITDARELHFSDLGQLIEAANATRFLNPGERLAKMPKVLKTMSVLSNRVAQVAAKGLNSASFGYLEVTVYPTLEEALDKARDVLRDAGVGDISATA